MKNNKGISLVALVVMIIIMIILAAVAINITMDAYDESQRAKQKTERQEVIEAVSGRFGDYMRNHTANPLLGLIIPEENVATMLDVRNYIDIKLRTDYGKLVTEDEILNHTQTKEIEKFIADNFNDMEYTRILLYDDLLELGVENVTIHAVYLVNYYSSDVIGPIT